MQCPHCKQWQVRCHTCDASGKRYLYCEKCKEKLYFVEKRDGTWTDKRCADCGCTMRHDIMQTSGGTYVICRHCGYPIIREIK